MSEADKAALLASASIILYPSRAESFGLVFLEAWAFGLPVIGCRVGAIPDVVEHGVSGLLISPDDSEGLAACVSRLIDDPAEAKRLGAEGRVASSRSTPGALWNREHVERSTVPACGWPFNHEG